MDAGVFFHFLMKFFRVRRRARLFLIKVLILQPDGGKINVCNYRYAIFEV